MLIRTHNIYDLSSLCLFYFLWFLIILINADFLKILCNHIMPASLISNLNCIVFVTSLL